LSFFCIVLKLKLRSNFYELVDGYPTQLFNIFGSWFHTWKPSTIKEGGHVHDILLNQNKTN
jgi:hypothetical protein